MFKKYILPGILFLNLALTFSSCEKYLDKAPESDLTEEEIFADFAHAQGFVEEMYYYVVNYAQSGNQNDGSNFLLGDETIIFNTSMNSGAWDLGNFWNYKVGYFERSTNWSHDDVLLKGHMGIWDGWEAIRRANQVIANEHMMVGCTQTEKNLLLGQAYFFRAYFHMEIMKFWGRIPYVDKVLTGNNDDFKLPRPATYKECAMKADEDFARAAELLPYNWDDLQHDPNATFNTFKPETFGKNLMRINKAIVYSFKGKNLLLAASPLMKGSMDTYDYDKELCERAAEDLARVIQMDRDNVNDLGLATKENYSKTFHTEQKDNTNWPGTAKYMGGQGEYIFSSPSGHPNGCRAMPSGMMPLTQHNKQNRVNPSHAFVHKTFGTAHGLPCDEDKTHDFQKEFDNRDPRFYENHIIDGDMIIQTAAADPSFKYAQMYRNASLTKITQTPTGYFIKKWAGITFNYKQAVTKGACDDQQMITAFWLSMRLTDVYLMYAEALAASDYGPIGRPTYSFMPDQAPTALEVVNMFRDRFGVPHAEVAYMSEYAKNPVDITTDRNKFMDVLRNERAVELCYEAHRWTDLRRWVLAHKPEYKAKTALEYDRDKKTTGDRSTFTNINFSEKTLRTRVCDYPKHYWLPFPTAMTQLYEGFDQNPGW